MCSPTIPAEIDLLSATLADSDTELIDDSETLPLPGKARRLMGDVNMEQNAYPMTKPPWVDDLVQSTANAIEKKWDAKFEDLHKEIGGTKPTKQQIH